jgi:glutathione S-transferase
MLTLHHLQISQSDRIVWLCEELEIPYELKLYPRDPVTRAAPGAYKALHPFGTAPVITDGELTLGESAAVIEYIVARYGEGRLIPRPDDPAFADYLYWFHFANGSMQPSAMVDLVLRMVGGEASAAAPLLTRRAGLAYAMVEARLGKVPFFAGEAFTAADVMMLFPLTTMRLFSPRDISPYPNLRAYLARTAERPALKRALAKSDPGLELKID